MRDTVRMAITAEVIERGLENIKSAKDFAISIYDTGNEVLDKINMASLSTYCSAVIKVMRATPVVQMDIPKELLDSSCNYVKVDSLANMGDMDLGVVMTVTEHSDEEPEWLIMGVSAVEFASDVEATPLTAEETLEAAEEAEIYAKDHKIEELEERLCKIEDFLHNLGLEFNMFSA